MGTVFRMVAFCSGAFKDKYHVFDERFSCRRASDLRVYANVGMGCHFCIKREDGEDGLCRWLKVHYAPVRKDCRG